jgi:hypothetical protein
VRRGHNLWFSNGAIGMNTLLLDTVLWDLVTDASGNIAMATDPYSTAQDVASACRTFLNEVYYDTTLGVPYFQQILGELPPLPVIKAQLINAANTVPGVSNAVCYLTGYANGTRALTGVIQFTDTNGVTQSVGF